MTTTMNNIQWYYSTWKNQYKIIKYLFNREFAILPCKNKNTTSIYGRNLRVHNIQHFQFMIKRFSLFEDDNYSNLYYSMAKFKNGIPIQSLASLSNEKRKLEEWNKTAYKEIESYDMLIDIDAGTHGEMDYAIDSAKQIKNCFDRNNCPYHLRFSGMGFHFIIPYAYFPSSLSLDPNQKDTVYKYMRRFSGLLSEKYSEMIDLNIYDHRRICKIPYSISIYDDVAYLCSPVDLDKFNIDEYKSLECVRQDILHNSNGNIFKVLGELKFQDNKHT